MRDGVEDATVRIFGGLYYNGVNPQKICAKSTLRSRCVAALKNNATVFIFGRLYGGCAVAVLTGADVTILFILRGSHHTAPPSAAGSTCMRAASSCTRKQYFSVRCGKAVLGLLVQNFAQ
jgi:hypothetical protein